MGQQLIDFVANLQWRDWLTIGGFLFGIVTLIAYIEQRRSTKDAAKLIKWAELNLDKTISEEEIKKLLAQKSAMEDQIAQNIPALARIAVLKEQAELHRTAIAEHFSAWEKLTSELGSAVPIPGLEPQIQTAILDRIVPRFEREQEVNRLRTRITVLSVGVAAASTVLPFGLGSVLGVILAPALISAALRLYALSEESTGAYKSLRPWIHIAYGTCALLIGGFGVLLLTIGGVTSAGVYIAYAACGVGLTLILVYPWARKKIDHWLAAMVGYARPL
jgi:hypothetical protein